MIRPIEDAQITDEEEAAEAAYHATLHKLIGAVKRHVQVQRNRADLMVRTECLPHTRTKPAWRGYFSDDDLTMWDALVELGEIAADQD